MIIIKSQYNDIEECKVVSQSENKIYANNGHRELSSIEDCVGEYKSEERAKEIMKMIEGHIEYVFSETMYYNVNNGKDQSGDLHIPQLIFEMPKE